LRTPQAPPRLWHCRRVDRQGTRCLHHDHVAISAAGLDACSDFISSDRSRENHTVAKQIIIDQVFKVFGDQPEAALDLVRQGASKQDILAQTACTIGVFDASFTIEAGEIFVIMGLSGSGKSTMVRMLNRLIEPTAGRILIDGNDINTLPDAQLRALRRKDISMVFQSFALLPQLTVLDNTAFGMELAGTPKAERHALALQALDQVGLAGYGASYPDELSGGMQQRVGLARALACDPAILLMDEAFSALDPIMRTEMQSELLRLQQIKRRTIVFISHDLDEAMRIGDRVAIMKDGHVVQVARPKTSCASLPTSTCATSCAASMPRPCSRPAISPVKARSWCRSRRRAVHAQRCRCWKNRIGPTPTSSTHSRNFWVWSRPTPCAAHSTATSAHWASRMPTCPMSPPSMPMNRLPACSARSRRCRMACLW
jgi:ABC-type proline/glycine betaine transport system ATPase subunit